MAECIEGTHRDVFIFFTYIRQHITQRPLAVLFGLTQSTISRIISDVRAALVEKWVPMYLGNTAFSR
ncbi:MAG: transposase family protein [Desulfobacteraceae bacterium]|nr:transposase family protein [Desulfobacteraceae bacterium]